LPKEKEELNKTECKVDELLDEKNQNPYETMTSTKIDNSGSINEIESPLKHISFNIKCNHTFGLDDEEENNTPVNSPKFKESTNFLLPQINSDNTTYNNVHTQFDISTPSQSGTEESTRYFIKEKLCDLKEKMKTLLFTVNDPEKEEMVK
jgi:hypothetical protein